MEASETIAATPPPEAPAPEPTAPEPTPPEPVGLPPTEPGTESPEPAPEEPAGVDISEGLGELRTIRKGLERAGVDFGEEDGEPIDRFLGRGGEEPGEPEPAGYGEPAPTDPASQLSPEEQQIENEINQRIEQAVGERVDPVLTGLEMGRREDAIRGFAKENPNFTKPEVLDAVDQNLRSLDPNFGQPGYAPDPEAVRIAYFAAQAELAAQPSTGAAAPEQSAGEPVSQPGTTLETGAGPGAPTPQLDPTEQAYQDAIKSGDNPWKTSAYDRSP